MTNDTSLSRKLAKLTGEDAYVGKALRLGRAGQPEALSQLLQSIDDTMLQRDAVFAVGDSSATLRISGKRVQMLVAASDDLNASSELIQTPLGAENTDALEQLGDVLKALTSKPGTLTLERRAVMEIGVKAGSGVGVQTLSATWDVDLDAEPPAPMDMFVSQITTMAHATLTLRDGHIDVEAGESDPANDLRRVIEEDLAPFEHAHKNFGEADKTKHLRILDRLGPVDTALVIGAIEKRTCFALVPVSAVAQAAAAWAGVVA